MQSILDLITPDTVGPAHADDYQSIVKVAISNIGKPSLVPSLQSLFTALQEKYKDDPAGYQSLRTAALNLLDAIRTEFASRAEGRQ